MMSSPDGNERRHQRSVHISAFAYRLPSRTSDILFGVISNISDAGMCAYSDARLEKGDFIEFRSTLPVNAGRAMVRWIRKDASDLYKIGFMFL